MDESDDDVNWKAAGEDYGERSDEEDMLLEEAVLAGGWAVCYVVVRHK